MGRRWALVLIVVAAAGLGGYALASPASEVSSSKHDYVPPSARQLVSQLAVLRRRQTAGDRSFPATLRRVVLRYPVAQAEGRRITRFGGYVASLTRLVETLPDGREVFMFVWKPDSLTTSLPAAARKKLLKLKRASSYTVGLVFLQPDREFGHGGQPIAGGGGQPTVDLSELRQPSCFGFTDHMILPDGIARVRWSFARQDALGFVYKRPLTVNVAVHNNAAIAAVTARTPCEGPDVATAYASDGRVIASYGNPGNLNRITRPIRHGRPWGP